ncbi:MAG: hypothetical protein ACYDA0_13925 [Candidatus Dormibacteraceae bacterium]
MGALIAAVWMMALFSGGVLAIGLIALAAGRAPFTMPNQAWTNGEARQLGAVWTVVGATYAIWGLLGGVMLGIERETRATNPFFGHWWGFLVIMIPGLVLVGGLLMQFEIYSRHRRRLREGVSPHPE